MSKLDWLIELLQGKLDIAEQRIGDVRSQQRNLVNLLAVKFLKKDFQSIVDLTGILFKSKHIKANTKKRIVEYRLLALNELGAGSPILETLRLLRGEFLYIKVLPYPLLRLADLEDLLDEQKLIFVHRQLGASYNLDESVISGVVVDRLYKNIDDILDKIESRDEKAELLAYISVALASISKSKSSRRLIDKAINYRDFYITRVALGKVNYLTSNLKKAFNNFMFAIRMASRGESTHEALVNIAQLYLLSGDLHLALDYISAAIKKHPDPFARLIRAVILLRLQKLNEAKVAFKALLSVRDRNILIWALLGLAECYTDFKNYKKAFEYAWKAYMLEPDNGLVSFYVYTLKKISERSGV